MELKTIVLEGIEYVLVPREMFDFSSAVPTEEKKEISLSDFEVELPVIETKEKNDSIVVVNTMPGVKKATGGEYGFAKRLKQRKLIPEDVMVTKTKFEDMPETPEIARNDSKNRIPPGKWGFYGAGAERDLG